jgi:hypothetical protein
MQHCDANINTFYDFLLIYYVSYDAVFTAEDMNCGIYGRIEANVVLSVTTA